MDATMAQVGQTPLVQVSGVWAKLACTNPSGSVKDRIAAWILDRSEALGLLKPGMEIIEATSGNTGIALAQAGRARGYRVTIVMPENMTEERKAVIRALGADLVLCSKEGGFAEAARVRDRLAAERGAFNPNQFSNPLNVECHRETTGREILAQLQGSGRGLPDAFVAGVGTGGTLIGVAQALGDRLLLMQEGRIRQAGAPAEVFARPADPALAALLGVENVVKVRVLGRDTASRGCRRGLRSSGRRIPEGWRPGPRPASAARAWDWSGRPRTATAPATGSRSGWWRWGPWAPWPG
jgi:threonine synthase